MSHITGGGFYENIPRSAEEGLRGAALPRPMCASPPIFDVMQREGGNSPEHDMFNTV